MPNYEIMLILDPKEDIKVAEQLSKDVFGSDVKKFEKLDRTELAYPINNSTTGTYILMNVETEGRNIKEFTRKVNINKSIWREMIINVDEEKANKIAKPRKPFENRNNRGPRKPSSFVRRESKPTTAPKATNE